MKKRLKAYLKLMSETDIEALSPEELAAFTEDLLIQIGFFQHERIVHLIVTVLFAVLTFMALAMAITMQTVEIFALVICLLILLIPYIKHYYLLENGTQKLYVYYDRAVKAKK